MSFIFGGNTGTSYSQLQRQREIAEQLARRGSGAPRNVGEGLSAIGDALAYRIMTNKANAAENKLKGEWADAWGGLFGSQDASLAPIDVNSPSVGADPRSGEAMYAGTGPSDGSDYASVHDVIKGFEGYRDTPYWDVNAHRVGYGSDTVTLADGSVRRVTPDMKITREDAERDLQRRVESEFMPRAKSASGEKWASMTPSQKAVLTSIAYNYGEIPDRVARVIATGDDKAIAAAIEGLGGDNDGVNRGRRSKEAQIYLSGASPAAHRGTSPQGVRVADASGFNSPGLQKIVGLMSSDAYKMATPGQQAIVEALLQKEITRMTKPPKTEAELRDMEIDRLEDEQRLNELQNPKAPAPEVVDINGVGAVWDEKAGRYVPVQGFDTEEDYPSSVQEYQFAQEQGFQGTYEDWIKVKEGAGATNISNVVSTANPPDARPLTDKPPKGFQRRWDAERQTWVDEPIPGGAQAAEEEQAATKADLAFADYDRKFNLVDGKLDEAIASLTEKGRWVAGWGSLLANAPESEARDFQGILNTIRANLGFEELQNMRDNSPTGGALGQVSEREIAFLQAMQGDLDAAQSPEQLLSILEEIKTTRAAFRAERMRIMNGGEMPQSDAPQTFEQFAADPRIRAAAEKYGVTVEEMWQQKQEGQ